MLFPCYKLSKGFPASSDDICQSAELCMIWSLGNSLICPFIYYPLHITLQLHWPPCYSLNMPCSFLPRELCIHCPLCLEFCSPNFHQLASLLHSDLCSNITFSLKSFLHTLTRILLTVTASYGLPFYTYHYFLGTYYFLIYMFVCSLHP